jgi:hypothetical protein
MRTGPVRPIRPGKSRNEPTIEVIDGQAANLRNDENRR